MTRCMVPLVVLLGLLGFVIGGCAAPEAPEATISVIQTTPVNMQTQLKAHEIDGFIAWEPFNAQAVVDGYGRYLVQSSEVWPNHPCCVLAMAGARYNDALADALTWAHVKATRLLLDPQAKDLVLRYAMEFTGKSEAAVSEALRHLTYEEYPNGQEIRRYYQGLLQANLVTKPVTSLGYDDEDSFFTQFLSRASHDRVTAKLASDPNWRPAAVPQTSKVQLGFLTQDLHELAVYVAQEEGLYEAVGLEVGQNLELKQYANGVAVMQAFKAGELTAAYLGGAPATMKRINDGIDIRIIGGANKEGSAIVVSADSAIKTVGDLKGKTVAIPGLGTVQHFVLQMVAEKIGARLVVK